MALNVIEQIVISRISRTPQNPRCIYREILGFADPTGVLQSFYISSPEDTRRISQLITFHPGTDNRALMTFYPQIEILEGWVRTKVPAVDRTVNFDQTHIFPVPGVGIIKIEKTITRWDLYKVAESFISQTTLPSHQTPAV